MGYRPNIDGLGLALSCDKTTTGARLLPSIPLSQVNIFGFGVIRIGDKTTPCPACGNAGKVVEGAKAHLRTFMGVQAAVDRCEVMCGCPRGSNRIIAPLGQWLGNGPSPEQQAAARQAVKAAAAAAERAEQAVAEQAKRSMPVFAKSRARGNGNTEAGKAPETHENFATMGYFRTVPLPEPEQHAQSAKRAEPSPEPEKPWYKKLFGGASSSAPAMAVPVAASSVFPSGSAALEWLGGRFLTTGTWAVRAAVPFGEVVAAGAGAPIAVALVGMMPRTLNSGEQDFIDQMRLAQSAESRGKVPTRVRFRWVDDGHGRLTPVGYHTSPESGLSDVRVRMMEFNRFNGLYEFTTEGENRVTIYWNPDKLELDIPSNTGHQDSPNLPSSITVHPIPEKVGSDIETFPAPTEGDFEDYILIFPLPDMPPIYIYIRNNSGQVTGKGQKITGVWLGDADKGTGSPVPNQIADKLRGRTFANFDRFREAFWEEVSKDPDLSKQFVSGNVGRLRKGLAPRSRFVDTVGKRRSFEIHHIKPISQGGDVYNVDNMGITTPKRHIDLHKGG